MKGMRHRGGMSLVEILVTMAIITVIVAGGATLFTKNIIFFKRIQIRQQVMSQSRSCMERIEQMLRNGKASTLVIETPTAPPAAPNSKVLFALQKPLASGTNEIEIYLEGSTVYVQELRPGADPARQALASNVTGLTFSGDSTDPAIVSVSLHIDAPVDTSRNPPQRLTLILPDRVVRMADAL